MTPDYPSWATMPKGTPSSASSSPSDDSSPVSSSKTRKRKISTQASQNGKRPKLGQSATQPVPKRSVIGKNKHRNASEGTDNRDWSPGQEVDAVQATQSARAQASTSASASASTLQVPTRRKKERARKSTGTMKAPLSSSARTGKRPSLSSASASQGVCQRIQLLFIMNRYS
ncbi:hypothetical protein FIBSPDRAFT_142328 [Athelia psychrophila]|uniref:Uncharacterized protein n=1 Tax=Athelia psychrophila TaxID=1759441 RepID=A0A166T0G1_9AGAM|nr:hypothetical protein FIBSPDRAFT_142328 [Fibularhizoctonia sp. CBS 109695]